MFNKIKSFLTENKTLSQTVIKNTFWMSVGQITSRVIRAVLIIYAARILGAAGYGAFSYALSLAGFFTIFADIGLTPLLTRDTSKNPALRNQYIGTAFVIKLGLLAISSAIILAAYPALNKITEAAPLLPLIVLLFAFDSVRDFTFAITRSLEKMEMEAGINVFTNIAILVLGVAILVSNPTSLGLMTAYTIGAGLGTILSFWKLRNFFSGFWKYFNSKLVKPILTEAWPFGVVGLLNTIMLNTDTIMLSWFRPAQEIGFYAVAQRIVVLLYLLPGFIAVSTMPAMSRFVAAEFERFQNILKKAVRGALLLGFPLMAGGIIVAKELITLLFGKEYEAAAPIFQVLLLTLPVIFPGFMFNTAIFATNKQKYLLGGFALGAVGNVILNLILIPPYGGVGSAIGTIITQVLNNGLNGFILYSLLKVKFWGNFHQIVIATVIMAALVFGLKVLGLNVLLNIVLGALAYFSVLYLLREPLLGSISSQFKRGLSGE